MFISDVINGIYKKSNLSHIEPDTQMCITLSKWIGFDSSQLSKLSIILHYLWYIEPKHFFYLLYFTIDRKSNSFVKKPVEIKVEDNVVHNEIQRLLKWSDREKKLNKSILKLAFKDEKHWKMEFGLK